LLDQQFERAIAAATGGDFIHAGLGSIGIDDGTHAEALQKPAPGNVFGQFVDRDAGLGAPHVRLAENQLVEGNVAR
jgi:hypothetical protein